MLTANPKSSPRHSQRLTGSKNVPKSLKIRLSPSFFMKLRRPKGAEDTTVRLIADVAKERRSAPSVHLVGGGVKTNRFGPDGYPIARFSGVSNRLFAVGV